MWQVIVDKTSGPHEQRQFRLAWVKPYITWNFWARGNKNTWCYQHNVSQYKIIFVICLKAYVMQLMFSLNSYMKYSKYLNRFHRDNKATVLAVVHWYGLTTYSYRLFWYTSGTTFVGSDTPTDGVFSTHALYPMGTSNVCGGWLTVNAVNNTII